jgi:hypothetical protein
MPIRDPISIAHDAMTALLNADSAISLYNWRPWESNTPHANLPRGYVNVSSKSAMNEAALPQGMRFEVVIESKPQVALDPLKTAEVLGQICRSDLAAALTALITDGSITFLGRAEDLELDQSIVGETRQYKFIFMLYSEWNVIYGP